MKKLAKSKVVLPAELADKYEVREDLPQVFACEFGEIDLSKISPEKAQQLADAGYLKKLH